MSQHRNTGSAAVEQTSDASQLESQYFGTAKEIVDRYTHCGMCGSHLHFTYLTDFSRNLAHEVAKCPECGFKTRRVVHRLQ